MQQNEKGGHELLDFSDSEDDDRLNNDFEVDFDFLLFSLKILYKFVN